MSAEVKPGYKMTEVGVLPEDWSVQPLAQLVSAVEYGSSAKSASSGDVPVLRMGNLQGGKIDWSDLVFTSDLQEIERYTLKAGDVLFNRTNTVDLVGKTAIYEGNFPAIFAGYLIRIKEKKDLLDSRYLNYILNSEPSKKYGSKVVSIAVGQANINGQKLKTYPIPLPSSLDEQKRIADAIAEMEDFIVSIEQLITKKRDIKQATMEQLLTGQKRLPGFSGKWHAGALADVISSLEAGVSVNSTDDIPSQGVPSILKTSSLAGGVFLPHECKVIATRDLQRAQTRPKKDTILISRMNTPMLVGEVAYVDRDYDCLYLPDRVWMSSFKPGSETSARWLAYLLSSRNYRDQLREIATGTSGSMKNISKGALLALPVQYPSPSEQAAIATILSDMDAELAALKARRDKAHQLKQGMMQELLTGRIRLLDPQPAPSGLPAPELQD